MEHYGLFPRTAIEIWKRVQGNQGMVLTITLFEDYCFELRDMVSGGKCRLDVVNDNEPYGYSEHRLVSFSDIIKYARIVEQKRATNNTKMNQTSSRSHACMKMKLYRKEGDCSRVNFFSFIDLAGSERLRKTENTKYDFPGMEGIMTNFSLLTVTKCILALKELKRPMENGEKMPKTVPWREMFLTRVFMRPAFNGRAYAVFNFCISQHQLNSGETWCAMEFADKVKDLVSIIHRPPLENTEKLVKELEKSVKKFRDKHE
jgi:hypothetical protein